VFLLFFFSLCEEQREKKRRLRRGLFRYDEDFYSSAKGSAYHVLRSFPSGESDNEIGFTFINHALIANGASGFAVLLPVSMEYMNL
jgi:hypothetical protein